MSGTPQRRTGGALREFLMWLEIVIFLLIVALLVFGVIAYVTGGEVADWEMRWLAGGMFALLLMVGLGQILDPNAKPTKRRRR
ncbi:hypothetical protein MED01_002469 [Micromonospora sp. MED01]|uniref:hypothetical protein n=1 Tax=Micromonospora alfalfae TaxID=2911212 RepID=UPI001EE961FC|nr:hypothetical protein [Micromonospora alfalfae]MCG5464303.1 hypothetical protein [Micromonospora alfalfae]